MNLIRCAFAGLVLTCSSWASAEQQGRTARDVLGSRFDTSNPAAQRPRDPPRRAHRAADMVLRWNGIALSATGLDHTPVEAGEARAFGEQFGPVRASRAMAIVHIAIADAVSTIEPRYRSYTGVRRDPGPASMEAAIAQAGHDTLAALFPSQASRFDELLHEDLEGIHDGLAKLNGIGLGGRTASAILEKRSDDGSNHVEPRMGHEYLPGLEPGIWRQDPVSLIPIALGAYWKEVEPFVLRSGDQFRTPPPPPLNSAEYTAAYREVLALGGDGVSTATVRTPEQTEIGIYWAYDGTPTLCAPPRLYNQIAMVIAEQMGTASSAADLARLLALANVAMADTGIAVWDSKYHYAFWRPVTGIRESDPGMGPTGKGDGNADTIGDPEFVPLGAPASQTDEAPDFTPPFPAYPSGHAGFGGALFEVLRRFYGTDDIPFTFVSDEFNGTTVDRTGDVRERLPRSFSSLSEAEQENGQSRVYLGIHWAFDKTEGIAQGRRVARYVVEHAFRLEGR